MRRRDILAGCLLGALAGRASAQERRRISILHSGFANRTPINLLFDALRTLGYEDGRTATIELLSADGDLDRLGAHVTHLMQSRPDVIIAITPPAVLALKQAGATVPIVFLFVTDPVGLGIVESLARPGRNFTGISSGDAGIGAKRLELLCDTLPGVRRIAVIWSPAFLENAAIVESTREAAQARGVELYVREIRGRDDLAPAFADASRAGAQAAVFMTDNALFADRTAIAALALAHRLPTIHSFPPEVQDGGLMSFGNNLADRYRRAASLTDMVLRGARPADIPIEQPTTFTLTINMRTAAAFGIVFPPAILVRADDVIE